MLTRIGIFILSKDFWLMSLNYFYYIHNLKESISKYDELIYGWVSYVKNDYENFLKYGTALLMFAIKVNDLKLIDDIYKRFENDPENNKAFLSIITTSMPLLNAYYPEYVARYSSDTNMIINSSNYKIEHLSTSHLYPFSSNTKIIDYTSIFWRIYDSSKYNQQN